MTIRLDDLVLRGEFGNDRRNSVRGWVELAYEAIAGDPEENGELRFIHLEFAGNLHGNLAGKKFRFETRDLGRHRERVTLADDFQDRQIGVIGKVVWQQPASQESSFSPADSPEPSLRFEWFGQNGPIEFELLNPRIEFDGEYSLLADPFPDDAGIEEPWELDPSKVDDVFRRQAGRSEDDIPQFDNYTASSEDSDAFEDSEFTPPELEDEEELAQLNSEASDMLEDFDDEELMDEDEGPDNGRAFPADRPHGLRPWDEVIPGIDPDTKAMYEQWDEVTHGTHDEPLTWLFDGAYKLPRPDSLTEESEAEDALRILLAQLARCGVAFEMCEHFSAIDGYRLLVEDILPEATVHPRLVSTGFVMHFSSYEDCPICEAELGLDFVEDDPDERAPD